MLACSAPLATAAGVPGMLLLSNGNLISGDVARTGDYYRVQRPGSELLVPADQIDAFCRSAAEALEIRRRRTHDDAAGRIQLARWCLRNELLEQAAGEILVARSYDPNAPGLAFAERQLATAIRNQARPDANDAAAKGEAPPSLIVPSNAVRASHVEDAHASPSVDFVASVEARAQFVRCVQPMMIHSCATAGCHQADAPLPMPLDRMAIEGGGSAAAIERNLQVVLQLLDPEKPDESQLVAWARRNHATSPDRLTSLTPHQAALLVEWAREAVGWTPPPEPIAAPVISQLSEAVDASLADLMPTEEEMQLRPDQLAEFGVGADASAPSQPPVADSPTVAPQEAQRPVAPPKPRDPFDPAEFNWRTRQRRQAERAGLEDASLSSPVDSQRSTRSANAGATRSTPAPTQ